MHGRLSILPNRFCYISNPRPHGTYPFLYVRKICSLITTPTLRLKTFRYFGSASYRKCRQVMVCSSSCTIRCKLFGRFWEWRFHYPNLAVRYLVVGYGFARSIWQIQYLLGLVQMQSLILFERLSFLVAPMLYLMLLVLHYPNCWRSCLYYPIAC